MQNLLSFIDIFPVVYTLRLNYDGDKKVKSSLGGCGTIIYAMILIGLFIFFAVPVIY